MRTVFLSLVVLHALIHLSGFVKGFELREVKEISLPVSKSEGLLWLTASVLFLVFSLQYFFNSKWAWLTAFAAVALSQLLVILFWEDARYGTLANAIILTVSLVSLGHHILKNEFTSKVSADFLENNTLSTDTLTERDIIHLPKVVQKYLRLTHSLGQPKVKNFRAEFVGGMRSAPNDKYMDFESVQYNFYKKPSRYFFMEARKIGLPATGLHVYQNETATFRVKMLNWLTIINAEGDKLNQAETVTLFNDMCCIAPATLIDQRIGWELVNDTTVKGIFKNGVIQISALLYFNERGELVNFISNDRYDTDGKNYSNYPWSTPLSDYKIINGYFLPGKAKLINQKPEGDFTYGELVYKSVSYNLSNYKD